MLIYLLKNLLIDFNDIKFISNNEKNNAYFIFLYFNIIKCDLE